MPRVEIQTERAVDRGWEYQIAIHWDEGDTTVHAVRMDWSDFEHWSHGRLAPSSVAQVALEHLVQLSRPSDGGCIRWDLPNTFDLARVRRLDRSADNILLALRRSA